MMKDTHIGLEGNLQYLSTIDEDYTFDKIIDN
jgi:hypothetical protein